MKKIIKLRFQNGLSFEQGTREILAPVYYDYTFIESTEPEYIIFGPYGNDLPEKSERYIRIGYFCENIKPDMSICEWAFGIPREQDIAHPKYKKIQWHNLNPDVLIKQDCIDYDELLATKNKFCNFIYSNPVNYREGFFKALNKYKKVDSPGKSMNNMPTFDNIIEGDFWLRKKRFLSQYKFTIAFENYSYPGYQTEKLYDAMQAYSIPVYCGDPFITDIFNKKSFINAFDILQPDYGFMIKTLERISQMNFRDLRPQYHNGFFEKVVRKVKYLGRELKMQIEFKNSNYKKLVDKIVEIDENPELYKEMFFQPWFNNNRIPEDTYAINRWKEIFG